MPVKKVDKILVDDPSSGGALQKLLRNANDNTNLTRVLKSSCPEHLSDGVRSVKKSGPILYIECLNASIATNIRFESDSLKASLSRLSDFGNIEDIKPFVGKLPRVSSDP